MTRKLKGIASIIAFCVIIAVGVPSLCAATTYRIGSGVPADNKIYFDTLAKFRGVTLASGDRIILYKDDDSLLQTSLNIQPGVTVTFEAFDPLNPVTITLNQGRFLLAGVQSQFTVKGIETIQGNGVVTETKGGGALRLEGVKQADLIDVNFIDNQTTGHGGAIMIEASSTMSEATSTVTIQVSDENTVEFSGNQHLVGGAQAANSITMTGESSKAIVLNIVTEGTGVLEMNDPMSGYNTSTTDGIGLYSITINKSGTGIWNLSGQTEIEANSNTTFNIDAGTLSLIRDAAGADPILIDGTRYRGASIRAAGNNGRFNLNSDATFLVGGENFLSANSVRFNTGALVEFDLAHYLESLGNQAANPMLVLEGKTLNISGAQIHIRGVIETGDSTIFTLMRAYESIYDATEEGPIDGTITAGNNTLWYNGLRIGSGHSSRISANAYLRYNSSEYVANLAVDNQVMECVVYGEEGTVSTTNWNFTTNNWYNYSTGASDSFIPGDTATIYAIGDNVIHLQNDMLVSPNDSDSTNYFRLYDIGVLIAGEGNVTFTGGSIYDDGTNKNKASFYHIGEGTVTFANTNKNEWSNGTYIGGGGTIATARGELLGSGGIYFIDPYSGMYDAPTGGTLHFTDTTTLDQKIYVRGTNGTVSAALRKILTITAPETNGNGGAASISNGRLTLTGYIQFVENQADNGAGIHVAGNASIDIEGTVFTENIAQLDGGAIYLANGATMTGKQLNFSGNVAERGGGLYVDGGASEFSLTDVIFTGNTAEEGGAVLLNNEGIGNGQRTITAGVFTDNSADYGGAITTYHSLTIADSTFTGNSANLSGGAIDVYEPIGNVTVTNSKFIGNTSLSEGGAIEVAEGSATLIGNRFESNVSGDLGGALNVELGGKVVLSGNNIFVQNQAVYGGAIAANDGTLEITGATFTDNTAADTDALVGDGGAVHAVNSNVDIYDSIFEGNLALGSGGAIYFEGGTGKTLTVGATNGNTTRFTGNKSNAVWDVEGNLTDGNANSIHLVGGADFVVDAQTGGVVDMLDAMTGEAGVTVTKMGDGTWKLAGTNKFSAGAATKFTVAEGVLQLYGTGDKDSSGNPISVGTIDVSGGTFTVKENATLSVGGGNTITAGTVDFQDGSILAFDLQGHYTGNTSLLIVNATRLSDTSPELKINLLNLSSGGNGNYNLLTLAGGATFAGGATADMEILYRGEVLTEMRLNTATLQLTDSNKTLQLQISAPKNGVVQWTNASGDRTWNATSFNWDGQGDINDVKQFLHGDAVFFGDIGSGNVTINAGGVTIETHGDNRGMVVNNSASNDYYFNGGSIGGGGGLVKQGEGKAIFNQENYFSGGTIIQQGTLVGQNAGSFGTGDIEVKWNAVLQYDLDANGSGTVDNRITGQGELVKSGAGRLLLTNANNIYEGGTTILGGQLVVRNVGALGAGDISTGTGTQNGQLVFEGVGNDLVEVFAKTISGTGSVRASGYTVDSQEFVSNIRLNGLNTYEGGTRIDAGSSITAGNIAALGTGDVRNDGTLVFDLQTDGGGSFVPTISGNGDIVKSGSGLLEYTKANTYSGKTVLNKGTLRIMDSLALQNSVLDIQGGTFSFGNLTAAKIAGLDGDESLSISNENNKAVALTLGNDITDTLFSGVLSGKGSVTKVGAATQTFSGVNTYSGGTTIEDGRLVAVGVRALGTGKIVNNGELEFEIGFNKSESSENNISGTGSVVKSGRGTLVMNGTNTYSGGTVVEEGELVANTVASLGSGNIQVLKTPTKTGTLIFDITEEEILAQKIYGSGNLIKEGAGSLIVNNDIGLSGTTDVYSGALFVNGTSVSATTVYDGATLGGAGYVNNDLLFRKGSSHVVGFHHDGALSAFKADKIVYEGGTTVYIKVGKNGSDMVVASKGFDFAQAGGTVNVQLIDLGIDEYENSDTQPRTIEVFRAENGTLLLDGSVVRNHESSSNVLSLEGVDGEIKFNGDGDGINVAGYSVHDSENYSRGIFLNVTQTGAGSLPYLNTNQRKVLAGIGNADVFDVIFRQDRDYRGDIVNELMPMIQTAMPYMSQRSVTQFNLATFERLRFLREPMGLTDADLRDYRGSSRRLARLNHQANYIWFQNYGDFVQMGGVGNRPRIEANTYGFNLGFDRTLSDNAVVGLGMGGYFSEIDANSYFQSAEMNSYLISAYGSWIGNAELMLNASLGFVLSSYDIDRRAPSFDTTLTSRHHGKTFFVSAEGSKKLLFGSMEVSPYLGLDLIWLDESDYREKARGMESLALNVKGENTCSVLSTLGVRIGHSRRMLGGNIFSPSIYAAWVHDWADGHISTTAGFDGQPTFRIRGSSMYRDRAQVGLNANMTVGNRIDTFARFNAELGRRLSDVSVHWGIRLGF